MRVLLIGCVKSTEIFFNKLLSLPVDIVGVVTKEESNYNSDFSDIGSIAEAKGIKVQYSVKANNDETVDFIKAVNPDIICCFGWSELLDNRILSIPQKGCIGFHPASLPNNRGRHPLIWALVLGLKETASTFFVMDEGADTGDIISQKKVLISEDDDAESLYKKIMDVAVCQLEEIVYDYNNGEVKRIKQNLSDGNSWRKRNKIDGQIDFRMPTVGIYNLVRALTKPYSGAHFIYNDKEIKVWKSKKSLVDNIENIEPGKIIRGSEEGNPIIKTGDGCIEFIETDPVVLKKGEYL